MWKIDSWLYAVCCTLPILFTPIKCPIKPRLDYVILEHPTIWSVSLWIQFGREIQQGLLPGKWEACFILVIPRNFMFQRSTRKANESNHENKSIRLRKRGQIKQRRRKKSKHPHWERERERDDIMAEIYGDFSITWGQNTKANRNSFLP